MPGQIYLGVDCQFSLISYGDVLGGFLSQSITIRNDPDSCLVRKMLLEQADNTRTEKNPNGVKILSDEWLIRMGWAYKDKNSEVVRLIDDEGRITGVILWEMGFDQDGVPVEIITIPIEGSYEKANFKGSGNDGVVYKQTSQNGHTSQFEIVYRNLNSLREIKNKAVNILKPSKDKDGHNIVPYGDCYDRLLSGFMTILGFSDAERTWVNSLIAASPNKNDAKVECILSLLDPTGLKRDSSAFNHYLDPESGCPIAWSEFKDVYELVAKKNLEVRTSVDREWSNRLVLLSLLGDSISTFQGVGQLFASISMTPNLLSTIVHPLSGYARANSPFFRLSGNAVPQPKDVDRSQFDSGKPTIALYDYANSLLLGKRIVAIPVFKEGPLSQDVNPDNFNERTPFSSSNVPIVSKENEFYKNVDYFLLYEYNQETGKLAPCWKETDSGTESNKYSKDEYVPASINEVAGFLRILSHMYSITTSYEDISNSNKFSVSPKFFVEQLQAMLFTKPVEALRIFRDLGGFEALSILRENKPVEEHSSNEARPGWFVRTDSEKDEEGNKIAGQSVKNSKDGASFFDLQSSADYTPTQTDLFIILLSITGAQRLDIRKFAHLPLTGKETKEGYLFICGTKGDPEKGVEDNTKTFDTNNKYDLKALDKLGYPVKSEGKRFFEGGEPLSFQELKQQYPDKLQEVKGIRLKENLSPETVREFFHGAIRGVPPLGQKCEWFEKVAAFIKVDAKKTDGKESGKASGYYSFANYILEKLNVHKEEVESKQGKGRTQFVSDAVRAYLTNTVAEIVKLRENLADEYFLPVLGIIDLYFIAEANAYDSEGKALNWFGQKYDEIQEFIEKYLEAAKKGNVYEVVYDGFKKSLEYVANKLTYQTNTELQGRLLHAMIKIGQISNMIDSIRPETATNPLAKSLFTASLYNNLKPRLDAIRTAVDTLKEAKIAKMSGEKFVYTQHGMQLVAMLIHQGLEIREIQDVTGFTEEEIQQLAADWEAHCQKNKITELQKPREFVSVLEQICQGPTKKAFNSLAMSGLMANGLNIGVGGALGSLHILPFITILGPVMQAVGFTAIASLEASTMSPLIYDFLNGNLYWGGALTRLFMNPDANILTSILMGLGVYLTDYCEFGGRSISSGSNDPLKKTSLGKQGKGLKGAAGLIDMDLVNVVLAGMQGGMINMGMGYASEDTIADLMKPILGVVGLSNAVRKIESRWMRSTRLEPLHACLTRFSQMVVR